MEWELRYALPFTPVASDAVWFGPPKGAWVLPGEYAIRLTGAAGAATATLTVCPDPRAGATPSQLAARHEAGQRVHALLRQWSEADARLDASARSLGADTATVRGADYRRERHLFRSGWGSLKSRILDLHGAIQSASVAPSEGQRRMLEEVEREMRRALGR